MGRRALRTALGVVRVGVGATALLNPGLAYRSLGAGRPHVPVGGLVARAFAARDLAIGSATLSADPATSRVGLRLGLYVDALDVVSAVLSPRGAGTTPAPAAAMATVAALFAAAGAVALSTT